MHFIPALMSRGLIMGCWWCESYPWLLRWALTGWHLNAQQCNDDFDANIMYSLTEGGLLALSKPAGIGFSLWRVMMQFQFRVNSRLNAFEERG